MALIIEDGTVVLTANSYVSVGEVRAYATLRGFTSLPEAEGDVEVLVMKAMDYVEAMRNKFQGRKCDSDQPLQWPRVGAFLDGYSIDSDEMPVELKNAVCQLAVDSVSTDLTPNGVGREVIRSKVGPLEKTYSKRGVGTLTPQLNKAMDLLKPLLKSYRGPYVTRA